MQQEDHEKLQDLIDDVTYAMLTTREADGTLHSRPMHTEKMQGGRLYFLTSATAPKAQELGQHPQVSVSYVGKGASTCVAVAGHARILRDRQKLQELWKPLYKAWFPKGLEDPDLAVLEVSIDRAEYWETPSTMAARVIGGAKAVLSGKSVGETMGENKKLNG